ncbi:MAG: transporter associated domain-containing protein [Oleiphilaceae bacterium]|nr:transporter associated domain-containing protein [Oleiphilaceae bacterium]
MSEDQPSSQSRTWLERISQAFSDQPESLRDIMEILREAEQRSVIDADSLSIIEGAMQVTDMQVREVMIPRSQMITVKASQEPEEYINEIIESAHSRFPVIGDSSDDVIGILLAKDLLPLALKGELKRARVSELLRPASIVPESKRLNQLLKEFKQTRNHMAIVVDEYGGIAGLVTIEDVLEQIVGEIEDEHDFDDEAMIKPLTSGEYNVKALTTIEEFNQYFEASLPEDEFDTIGGLVLKHFGRLPRRGDKVRFEDFRATVLNADNRTIRLLKIEKL